MQVTLYTLVAINAKKHLPIHSNAEFQPEPNTCAAKLLGSFVEGQPRAEESDYSPLNGGSLWLSLGI